MTMADAADIARQIADEARDSLSRVRAAWPWLTDARLPGSPGPRVTRPTTIRDALTVAETWRTDRAAQLLAVRAGIKPGGPHPAPARLAAVEIRHHAARELAALASRLWDAIHADGLVMLVRDPGERALYRRCSWCAGSGIAIAPTGWPWPWPCDREDCPDCAGTGRLGGDPTGGPCWSCVPPDCSRCRGHGTVPTGDTCQSCGVLGPCGCDLADVITALSVATLAELIDAVGVEPASDADVTLLHLAERIESVVGLGRDRRRLPGAECPACGTRELVPEVSSPDRREWSIRCHGPDCLCEGAGCPCGIGTPRREGRRHLWPARTWDGPRGLASRLGVALPGTAVHVALLSVPTGSRVGRPAIAPRAA